MRMTYRKFLCHQGPEEVECDFQQISFSLFSLYAGDGPLFFLFGFTNEAMPMVCIRLQLGDFEVFFLKATYFSREIVNAFSKMTMI